MSEKLTHWKKLNNPAYLGAYSLEAGKDLIVKIKRVGNEIIIGSDGKKEECMLMHLDDEKPMIVNSTNAKTITKVLETPYIEQWQGKRIQLYSTKVKAFGEVVEALRVRAFLPKVEQSEEMIKCELCKNKIESYGKMNSKQLAEYTNSKYGQALCSDCAGKQAKTETIETVKADEVKTEQASTEETDNEQA